MARSVAAVQIVRWLSVSILDGPVQFCIYWRPLGKQMVCKLTGSKKIDSSPGLSRCPLFCGSSCRVIQLCCGSLYCVVSLCFMLVYVLWKLVLCSTWVAFIVVLNVYNINNIQICTHQCSINQLKVKDYELQSIDSPSNKSIAESEALYALFMHCMLMQCSCSKLM